MSLRAEIAGPADLLEVHRRHPAVFPFLLQSVAGHPQSGRYDLLCLPVRLVGTEAALAAMALQ